MIGKINKAIKCSVQQCSHNDAAQGFCCLNAITVGTHELNPSQVQCTDCESFQLK